MGCGEAEEKVSVLWWSVTTQIRGVWEKLSLEMLTKSICPEISASLGEMLPKATPWTAFCMVGGMGLSLSSAFLRQCVRSLILCATKCKNPCKRQFRNTLPHLHQGGQLFAFEHFSQPQEHGEEVRAKYSSGLKVMLSWALFSPFSLLSHPYPKLWGCSFGWQGKQCSKGLDVVLSWAALSFAWPENSSIIRGILSQAPSNITQVRLICHSELS